MNYPCVVKCQSVCQSENLSKWAEWVVYQHCFNLSKSSRHSIKYNFLQIFLISCSESSLYNFGWSKAVACRSHTYSVFRLCIWICAIWKVGELLADLARRARAENQAKITGLEHLPCEERLGELEFFSLEQRYFRIDIISVPKQTSLIIKEMKLGSSQLCRPGR